VQLHIWKLEINQIDVIASASFKLKGAFLLFASERFLPKLHVDMHSNESNTLNVLHF